eukprot:CAMPEP_0195127028 /NCGR_PEP_ID=MMETSP0448-20130528/136153_1 /TAXON_ID=66468 /ORGANISM="Heterocapsa triquestra, Strain CCMP 448" /LENGTH=255 /DNA_ID=CAMNT_0040164739 /DNA_START=226 /DNA_END=992 /DNA_ORIENTATION=+
MTPSSRDHKARVVSPVCASQAEAPNTSKMMGGGCKARNAEEGRLPCSCACQLGPDEVFKALHCAKPLEHTCVDEHPITVDVASPPSVFEDVVHAAAEAPRLRRRKVQELIVLGDHRFDLKAAWPGEQRNLHSAAQAGDQRDCDRALERVDPWVAQCDLKRPLNHDVGQGAEEGHQRRGAIVGGQQLDVATVATVAHQLQVRRKLEHAPQTSEVGSVPDDDHPLGVLQEETQARDASPRCRLVVLADARPVQEHGP